MEDQAAAVASGKEGVSYQIREVTVFQIVRTHVSENAGSVELVGGTYASRGEAEHVKAILDDAK